MNNAVIRVESRVKRAFVVEGFGGMNLAADVASDKGLVLREQENLPATLISAGSSPHFNMYEKPRLSAKRNDHGMNR